MFDLPESYYQHAEATDRVSLLMQYTLLAVVELEFAPVYGWNWWKGELLPHILQGAQAAMEIDGRGRETAMKYRQVVENLRRGGKMTLELVDLDVTVLSSILLYDEGYTDLPIRRYDQEARDKYRTVRRIKDCRNSFSHGSVESRGPARQESLQELQRLMELYGSGCFPPNLVYQVFHCDVERSDGQRYSPADLQKEFGNFYESFMMASRDLEQPETREEAMEVMRQLARVGFRTALERVLDMLLHDPFHFSLDEAVELMADQPELQPEQRAQLALLRDLQAREAAARAGDAAAAMEMAGLLSNKTSPIYTPHREHTYYLLAWQSDGHSGMEQLRQAADRGDTAAWECLCDTRDPAAMDWLADRLVCRELPGTQTWQELSPWLYRLLDQGSRRALALLVGHLRLDSTCLCMEHKDPDRCRVCKLACEAGYMNVLAHRQLFWHKPCCDLQGNRETLELCRSLARRDPEAGQVALAGCLTLGIGTDRDPDRAEEMLTAFLEAAPARPRDGRGLEAAALYWMGNLWEYGPHRQPERAAEYYRRSAACGDFPAAGVQAFALAAADPRPAVRREAFETLARLEKDPTRYCRDGYFLYEYRGIRVTEAYLRRNPWIKNADHVKLALWEKLALDTQANGGDDNIFNLMVTLSNCEGKADILPRIREWGGTLAGAQLETLYLLAGPNPDLEGARRAWSVAVAREKAAVSAAGTRDHGFFRSHGRKDGIARATAVGLPPEEAYETLKRAGFRVPLFFIEDRPVLFGVMFRRDNPFYKWLAGLYLDRYRQERDAAVAAAHAPRLARIRWFEATRAVRRARLPGLPDEDSAVRLYLAGQGDAAAMATLLESRAALTGAPRFFRDLALGELILRGQAPGGRSVEQGQALLMESLSHAPGTHARAAALCLLGRYETDPDKQLDWFQRALRVDPNGILPCAALMYGYLCGRQYLKAVEQADRFWYRTDLRPYQSQALSTAWPETRALLDPAAVTAWAVALGQQAYLSLRNTDATLTEDNRAALDCLTRLDASVGDWRVYKRPPALAQATGKLVTRLLDAFTSSW